MKYKLTFLFFIFGYISLACCEKDHQFGDLNENGETRGMGVMDTLSQATVEKQALVREIVATSLREDLQILLDNKKNRKKERIENVIESATSENNYDLNKLSKDVKKGHLMSAFPSCNDEVYTFQERKIIKDRVKHEKTELSEKVSEQGADVYDGSSTAKSSSKMPLKRAEDAGHSLSIKRLTKETEPTPAIKDHESQLAKTAKRAINLNIGTTEIITQAPSSPIKPQNSEIREKIIYKISKTNVGDTFIFAAAKTYEPERQLERSNKNQNEATGEATSAFTIGSFKPAYRVRRDFAIPPSVPCSNEKLSCKNRCQLERSKGQTDHEVRCFCDPYCNIYEDCCYDYAFECVGNSTLPTQENEEWSCLDERNENGGIWMINSCPQGWKDSAVNQSCELDWLEDLNYDNYKDRLAVASSDGRTFRNRFCGLCHGIPVENLSFYGLFFVCSLTPLKGSTQSEALQFLFEYCSQPYQTPKEGMYRRYCIDKVPSCYQGNASQNNSLSEKCQSTVHGIVFEQTQNRINYKNKYCAYCNGVFNIACGPAKGFSRGVAGQGKSISVLMDLGGESSGSRQVNVQCSEGLVYDVYLETCRSGYSPSILMSTERKFRVRLWLKYSKAIPFSATNEEFMWSITSKYGLENTTVKNGEFVKKSFEPFYTASFDLSISSSNDSSALYEILNFEKPFPLLINNETFIVLKASKRTMSCNDLDVFSGKEYTFLPYSHQVFINITEETLNEGEYFANISAGMDQTFLLSGPVQVCRFVNCSSPMIALQKDEYDLLKNRSVFHKASGTMHKRKDYLNINNTIFICTSFSRDYISPVPNNAEKVLVILTYVGFSLSISFLLVFLVTFSIFQELRTLPGIHVMNLATSLLAAHMLWLAGSGQTEDHSACQIIAIALHYSFLSSFTWMSVIAFDTWRAFSRKTRRHNNVINWKRVGRVIALGWLPPLGFVILCVALDQSGTVTIDYGGAKGCWINNKWSNIFFFAVPVLGLLIWNIVFFVLTVVAIRKVMKQSSMAQDKESNRNDLVIYAKIASLMGFTWLFGFLAPFTTYFLMFPFVICNSLQGVFIAVAFLMNGKVKKLYCNLMKKKDSTNSSSNSTKHRRYNSNRSEETQI